jgi:hypothetical protein
VTNHAKKSDHLQLVDRSRTTMVEIPLPLLGAFANIERSFFDLCIDAGQQVLASMRSRIGKSFAAPVGSETPIARPAEPGQPPAR